MSAGGDDLAVSVEAEDGGSIGTCRIVDLQNGLYEVLGPPFCIPLLYDAHHCIIEGSDDRHALQYTVTGRSQHTYRTLLCVTWNSTTSLLPSHAGVLPAAYCWQIPAQDLLQRAECEW